MSHVFLERAFEPAMDLPAVLQLAAEAAPCFQLRGVAWRDSFLARDGRRMVCWFESPDAESVRQALREAGADLRVLWPGSVHPGPDPGPANVLVERSFPRPVDLETIQGLEDAGSECLQIHQVHFVRTFFATGRRRMLCLYRAPDAESVRLAERQAGVPLDTVWACTQLRAAAPPQLTT